MQILSIHLKNIKSHRDTTIDFSAGINVLSGPNGVGKSTIFEAIGYALFGVDARDFVSNIDRFLSIGAKRGEISVVFQTDDSETFRVNRTVGTGAKWLLAKEIGGQFEVEDHARLEETEARIAGLLGLDNGRSLAEQFKLVIGPFQNDFLGPFVIKQPTKRQEAFDEILGIDAWRKTYKGTSSLLSAVQERIKLLAVEVNSKLEQLEVLPAKEVELNSINGELKVKTQTLKDKDVNLKGVDDQLVGLDSLEKTITSLANDLQVLENRIKDGDGKINEQKLRVDEAVKAQKVLEDSRAGKEAYEKAEVHLIGLRQKELARRAVEQEISGLDKEVLRLTQALTHERSEIDKTEKQLKEEQKELDSSRKSLQVDAKLSDTASGLPGLRMEEEKLKGQRSLLNGRRESLLEGKDKLAEGICPFFQEQCRNIAGTTPRDVFSNRVGEHDLQISELDKRIEALTRLVKEAETAEKELNACKVRLQELDKQAAVLEGRFNKNLERSAGLVKLTEQQHEASSKAELRRADLKVFANLDKEIEQSERERIQHQTARDAFTANQNAALDLDNRNQHLKKMEQLLKDLNDQAKVGQAGLAEKKGLYQAEQHIKIRLEKESLLSEVATLRQQVIDSEMNIARLDKEIENLNKIKTEIEAKQVEIKIYEEKEKLVKFLRNQVFKNVSAQLSERFREEISLRADRIYRTIADSDEELYWGDNYQITLRDMHEGGIRERNDDQLSGGQMMSAVVALRLALLQTIGARVAFFDEPTSNLDASRRENLAHAFRAIDVGREEVTEHWYDQLFLVSHDVAFTEITDKIIEL
jgi:DNA repair protein SbcC/Rad50